LTYQQVKSLNEFRIAGITPNSQGLVVLTESGYLLLVKSFTDKLSWQVQKQLVKAYFIAKEAEPIRHIPTFFKRYILNKHIPRDRTSIMLATADDVIWLLESLQYFFLSDDGSAMPDISVGKGFVKHLKATGRTPESVGATKYLHNFPDGRMPSPAWVYPGEMTDEIHRYIVEDWLPNCLMPYLTKKDTKLDKIALSKKLLPYLLGHDDAIKMLPKWKPKPKPISPQQRLF